jgi:hypothetical protein
VRFDASRSIGAQNFYWYLNGEAGTGAMLEKVFANPGFYRVGLSVDNGSLASLAWRDLIVVAPVEHELGTEGNAGDWTFELEGNDGKGRMMFEDDSHALIGTCSLRFSPNPYPGAYATAIYPVARNASWNFAEQKGDSLLDQGGKSKPARFPKCRSRSRACLGAMGKLNSSR